MHDCSVEEGVCCIYYGLSRDGLASITRGVCNCSCHNNVHSAETDFYEEFIAAQSKIHDYKLVLDARHKNSKLASSAIDLFYVQCTEVLINLRKNLERKRRR